MVSIYVHYLSTSPPQPLYAREDLQAPLQDVNLSYASRFLLDASLTSATTQIYLPCVAIASPTI